MPTRKTKRTNWRRKYQIEQMTHNGLRGVFSEVRAENAELRNAVLSLTERAEAAERHNAELLKEREALQKCNRASESEREHWLEKYQALKKHNCPIHGPSWLRRNWVEIVVMTGVLGACALLVWWAWRG